MFWISRAPTFLETVEKTLATSKVRYLKYIPSKPYAFLTIKLYEIELIH